MEQDEADDDAQDAVARQAFDRVARLLDGRVLVEAGEHVLLRRLQADEDRSQAGASERGDDFLGEVGGPGGDVEPQLQIAPLDLLGDADGATFAHPSGTREGVVPKMQVPGSVAIEQPLQLVGHMRRGASLPAAGIEGGHCAERAAVEASLARQHHERSLRQDWITLHDVAGEAVRQRRLIVVPQDRAGRVRAHLAADAVVEARHGVPRFRAGSPHQGEQSALALAADDGVDDGILLEDLAGNETHTVPAQDNEGVRLPLLDQHRKVDAVLHHVGAVHRDADDARRVAGGQFGRSLGPALEQRGFHHAETHAVLLEMPGQSQDPEVLPEPA